ncbi:hypothetical protein OROGR_027536 [Orobanche gracilis]
MTVNEKKFIETALFSDLRIDGRGPFDYRNLTIQLVEDGSSDVQLGQTRVMGFVTSQLVQPYRDRPNEGTLSVFTEFSPMADPSFEVGRPGEFAVELGRIVDRGLRESRSVDTESLCVVAGKWVWSIRIDLHILDNGGNLVDAANSAALAALLTFRRPECTLGGEDGQEVMIHPPEMREPLPLTVHHLPITVTFAFIGNESTVAIDPSHFEEAVMGGKLTATLNANGDICAIQKSGGEAAEVYNSARDLKKIKQHPNSVDLSEAARKGVSNLTKEMGKSEMKTEDMSIKQDDMGIETHTSKKEESCLRDIKPKAFIGGPCRIRVNVDELKASLASRAVVTSTEEMDMLPSVKPQPYQSLKDADPSVPSLRHRKQLELENRPAKPRH